MSNRKRRCPDSLVAHTYPELERYATANLNLLIVVGAPGLAKTRTVREAIGDACWIKGNATAYGIYQKIYEHRDEPIVIDDVDDIYNDKRSVRLLKSLCETEETKTVSWESNACKDLPREFKTKSKVTIIANEWRQANAHVRAIQDRGTVVYFEPSNHEIHRHATQWFSDQEILDWFGERLSQIQNHSLRKYKKAAEYKSAGIDWRGIMSNVSPTTKLVIELLSDNKFRTEGARVEEFTRRSGLCRATFYNHAKRLRKNKAFS